MTKKAFINYSLISFYTFPTKNHAGFPKNGQKQFCLENGQSVENLELVSQYVIEYLAYLTYGNEALLLLLLLFKFFWLKLMSECLSGPSQKEDLG